MTKAETRAAAREFGLAVADKHDSQDICFVPSGKYADVIERLNPGAGEAGEIVHIDGRVLGRHAGIIHYTVGQRRGIGVAVGAPLYVVHLDAARRRVVVGPREALVTHALHLRGFNWIGEGAVADGEGHEVFARVRSTRPPVAADLTVTDGQAVVALLDGEAGVAPGRRACSTTARVRAPACWAAASSTARSAPVRRKPRFARSPRRPSLPSPRPTGMEKQAGGLDANAVVAAYARWAPIYDPIFGVITAAPFAPPCGR